MRWFRLAPLLVLLVACGGSAARKPKPSPSVAGAAGEPSSAAGTSTGAVAAEGGASGARPTEGGAAGVSTGAAGGAAGAGGVEASDAGAAGQPSQPACAGLDCLAGAELLYVPDREWQHTGSANTSSELQEVDYTALLGPTWRAKFSSDAMSLDLTPTAGGDTVHGTRKAAPTGRAWFDLTLFAGGRFVVQVGASDLQAELTQYGSGQPIVSSTRGLLQTP